MIISINRQLPIKTSLIKIISERKVLTINHSKRETHQTVSLLEVIALQCNQQSNIYNSSSTNFSSTLYKVVQQSSNSLRGHPFMTSTKNHVFDPPSPLSTWAGPPSPLVDVHTRST